MTFRLSPAALIEQRKTLEAVSDRHRAHLYSLQVQLGTWLVLGNGVALYTLAQAAFAGQVQQDAWLMNVYERFVIGLAIAFLAMAVSYFLALRGMYTIANLASQFLVLADADQVSRASEHPAEEIGQVQISAMNEIAKAPVIAKSMQYCTAINVIVYAVSGAFFLWGLAGCFHLEITPHK